MVCVRFASSSIGLVDQVWANDTGEAREVYGINYKSILTRW